MCEMMGRAMDDSAEVSERDEEASENSDWKNERSRGWMLEDARSIVQVMNVPGEDLNGGLLTWIERIRTFPQREPAFWAEGH